MVNIFVISVSGATNERKIKYKAFELQKKKQKNGMVHSEINRKIDAKK
jgi:hypothetical protein